MASYFITGSSRGLGLSMVTELVQEPRSQVSHIFASARKKSIDLTEVIDKFPGRVIFIQLDVTDSIGCEKAANKVRQIVGHAGLDVLINNAAANPRDRADRMDDLQTVLDSNVIGVRNVTRVLLPLLKISQEKKVVNISSALGSITLTQAFSFSQSCAAYKVSKAALNMLTSQWAMSFKEDGVIVLSVSPGIQYIKTSMGDVENGDLTPTRAAQAVLQKAQDSSMEDSGKFVDIEVPGFVRPDGVRKYTGKPLPY